MTWREENLDCVSGAPIVQAVDAVLVREIIAWFDVIQNKHDWANRVSEDWPHNWLRRARAATESREDSAT
jgi:hypothetical protein